MHQNDLNRAVAAATGETVSTTKRLGFLIADPQGCIPDPDAPELGGRVIDWNDFDHFQREQDAGLISAATLC